MPLTCNRLDNPSPKGDRYYYESLVLGDRLGDLSRKIGVIADAVYLVTGGYAVNLMQIGERLP